jgi:hypothetical protein
LEIQRIHGGVESADQANIRDGLGDVQLVVRFEQPPNRSWAYHNLLVDPKHDLEVLGGHPGLAVSYAEVRLLNGDVLTVKLSEISD